MLNFQFYNPTRIIFGKETVSELSQQLPAQAKVLILYGGESAVKNGTIDEVKKALGEREYFEFGGIEPNPHYETLLKAVALVKQHQIDFLLAVGGGSVIDGTKFVSLATCYEGDPWEILSRKKVPVTALPIGTVLTLPATGSEMNCRGVVTRAETKEKLSFRTPLVYPQFSILDPTKTYTLPERQLANGIVDSFMHTLEQYLTYPIDAKVPDYFAEGVLRTLIEIAPDVLSQPDNYEARANFMWAATVALNGFLATGVPEDWTTHRIGHELTALYGIDHARTLAIILPALLEVKKEAKRGKLLQYAKRVWDITEGSDEQKVDLAIQKTCEFFESVGIKTHFSDYGLGREVIEPILQQMEKHGQINLGEHQDITLSTSRQILEKAL
ncbi:iron-containing alcohol dehydrogenase [Zophobihabitans entericus]|uniref:Iron-containing alcohol dehydrogenase n=1 Tax=Zophobihabitans entericus TaxID=1635327 RepID=A0A6G9ICJ0_9GAMM|nr:iron-containing alcohol dehydrogenase [Zophobihabitans entericus]QIQ21542.1 iron-containing alcohol dehydrogenase [Zophobihabitans entericus]